MSISVMKKIYNQQCSHFCLNSFFILSCHEGYGDFRGLSLYHLCIKFCNLYPTDDFLLVVYQSCKQVFTLESPGILGSRMSLMVHLIKQKKNQKFFENKTYFITSLAIYLKDSAPHYFWYKVLPVHVHSDAWNMLIFKSAGYTIVFSPMYLVIFFSILGSVDATWSLVQYCADVLSIHTDKKISCDLNHQI